MQRLRNFLLLSLVVHVIVGLSVGAALALYFGVFEIAPLRGAEPSEDMGAAMAGAFVGIPIFVCAIAVMMPLAIWTGSVATGATRLRRAVRAGSASLLGGLTFLLTLVSGMWGFLTLAGRVSEWTQSAVFGLLLLPASVLTSVAVAAAGPPVLTALHSKGDPTGISKDTSNTEAPIAAAAIVE